MNHSAREYCTHGLVCSYTAPSGSHWLALPNLRAWDGCPAGVACEVSPPPHSVHGAWRRRVARATHPSMRTNMKYMQAATWKATRRRPSSFTRRSCRYRRLCSVMSSNQLSR